MDYSQLYGLVLALLVLIVGFFVGWLSNPFNKAKFLRVFGKHKKVILIVNAKGFMRDFLVENPIGEEPIKIVVKPFLGKILQEFTLFPNPSFDGNFKTIPFGLFDSVDCRQIPITQYAHYLLQGEVPELDSEGKPTGKSRRVFEWRPNLDLLEKIVPASKVQNILSTNASAARLKARNEVGQDKSTRTLLIIVATCGVVSVIILAYLAIQSSTTANLVGVLYNKAVAVAASPANYTAT